ncbi:MAG: RNB domain-containing ribonuclease [Desulfovibrio sp.]|nr:RNB domain-containing ribonuclease [Desulfovibrio sp.]
MADLLRYPTTGCIIEYLEGSSPQVAVVIGEAGERLRLLLPNRREVNLPKNRVLPWIGPKYASLDSREELVRLLEQHRKKRLELEEQIKIQELWEMTQGEVNVASAQFFCELEYASPNFDQIAAYGHALLACKTHFRFQPPLFLIYTAAEVEKRLAEQTVRLEREALLAGGRAFLQLLFEVALGRRKLPKDDSQLSAHSSEWPSPMVQERLLGLLKARLLNPLDQESENLWHQLSRGLPEAPQLPLQLLLAWGKLPAHYNVWLAQAEYQPGDNWWQEAAPEVLARQAMVTDEARLGELPFCDLPFISIDSATTTDIDDAFWLTEEENGWRLTLAFAHPSWHWSFTGILDKLVKARATSLYLPEMTYHMLPEVLGTDSYSLHAGVLRPAFILELKVSLEGALSLERLFFASVRLAANLTYLDCEKVLHGEEDAANPAQNAAKVLQMALDMARVREKARVKQGAVIFERAEPHLELEEKDGETKVILKEEPPCPWAQLVVAESMIAAGVVCAEFALAKNIPLLFRTQDVSLPLEYAGVWKEPDKSAKIMHSLVPSILELEAAPHAALGVKAYSPVTSPLRRYADLVNLAQIDSYLMSGQAYFSKEELGQVLNELNRSLERVLQVQRQRPRYWKLLYFKQQGDRVFWPGVITEENELFVMVYLPREAMNIRGKRALFGDRLSPGSKVKVRVGKVQPWWNEIQIVEAMPADEA